MADDFIVGMLSTDANQEGIDQVRPVLERAGYRLWGARSPGPLYDFHPEDWVGCTATCGSRPSTQE